MTDALTIALRKAKQKAKTPAASDAIEGEDVPRDASPNFPAAWAVFQCKKGTKEPKRKGYADEATNDLAQIAAWHAADPEANWAVHVGRSNLGVIDIDGKTGEQSLFEFELEYGMLPETREHKTPRGGRHCIFADPEHRLKNSVGKLGPKLDTRGSLNDKTGYILIPPSTFEGKPYILSKDVPLAALPEFVSVAAGNAHERLPASDVTADLDHNIARLLRHLKDMEPAVQDHGGELQTLAAGYAANELGVSLEVSVPLIAEHLRCEPPWEIGELRAKISNAYQYPQNGFGCHAARPVKQRIPAAAFDKLIAQSIAAPASTKPEKRTIQIQGGALPQNIDDAEAALIETKADIFQRGELLVRPGEIAVEVRNGEKVHDKLLVQVRRPELIEIMTNAANFVRYDARMDALKRIDCPPAVADGYLGRIGRQNVRPLMGIINAPTLRPDGSLLDAAGYDDATGLLYDPRGVEFPAIPSRPTKDDALRALNIFDELIGKFPFADEKARAVAFAAILTACIRKTLPSAPLVGIDGTGAGSGKGLLADVFAMIGGGRQSSPITAGPHEEELEKRVASLLIRGDHSICIDNLNDPLESSFLCSVLTQPTQSVRVLGQSRVVTTPTNSLFMATGNGLTFGGDLWRRGLICLIDPAMERPSERQFDFDPLGRAKENRPRYVAAALTILRAYQVAGSPKQKGQPMGSFDVWTCTVRDPLLWLGEADPVETCVMPADDPERERFTAAVTAWRDIIGEGRGVTLKEAIRLAVEAATAQPSRPELFDAFHSVAAPMVRGDDKIDGRRLAYWLRSKKRLVTCGFRLMPADGAHGSVLRWRLEKVAGRSP